MNRMEKYHADYVSRSAKRHSCRRNAGSQWRSSSALLLAEQRPVPPAARLWLECMDAATGEVERAPYRYTPAISALAAGTGFARDAMPGSAYSRGDFND